MTEHGTTDSATPPLNYEESIAKLTAEDGAFPVVSESIRGIDYRIFRDLPGSLRELYDMGKNDHGDKDFLVFEDTRLTYAETYDRAAAVAHQLIHRYGVEKGDRVAIGMRNFPEWVVAFMAITSTGAISVSLNAWWTGEELEYGLQESGSRVAFFDEERYDRVAGRLEDMKVQAIGARWSGDLPSGVTDIEDLCREGAGQPMPEVELGADDDVIILFTSGTTGFPKGALSTHRGVLSGLGSWGFYGAQRIAMGLLPEPEEDPEFQPAILMPLPLFHVSGCHAGLLASIAAGRKIVMMYKWSPEKGLELIERERVTSFNGVPTMTWEMLQSPDLEERDLRSLVAVSGGGAPIPGGMIDRLAERMPAQHWSFGWGMTETNGGGTSNFDEGLVSRPTSIGRPCPIVELKVVDDEGNDLATGEEGELVMKSPMNIRCYWNRPEETAETIRDGWLHTGDVAVMDDEGYFFIVDRKKDMILRGGENIYCAEIERVIYQHPAVFEAAAFGVPDPRLGEELAVVVMPKKGETLEADDIRAHVAEHLARYKVPRYVWLQDEQLPRGATGKIHKRGLRETMLREAEELR